ncbi:MAG: Tetraacyldisaccharide 4-kinase [Chlamydiales bacterium]|jgi:tetraacyldisaccharide 4'-kinase|nr:Tetraacyldisaccharide 4-kinase [Chlamydiales bacterium]
MRNRLKLVALQLIKRKDSRLTTHAMHAILHFFSWGYTFAVFIRNYLFDIKFIKTTKISIPVVSIGNITVGGTGKTPLTIFLAKQLSQNIKVAILSRGYGSQTENSKMPFCIENSSLEGISPKDCGDEPYLMVKLLSSVKVFINKNRSLSAIAAKDAGMGLLILDDGFQHRHLDRDVDIVIIDATDPIGQGYCLPRGLLREPLKNLKRANLIILNHSLHRGVDLDAVQNTIREYAQAPIIQTDIVIEGITDLEGNKVNLPRNTRVGVFSGIGQPEHFYKTLEQLGVEIVLQLNLTDHEAISATLLQTFTKNAQVLGAEYILCTQKDLVKIPKNIKLPLILASVNIGLKIFKGQEHWDLLIRNLTSNTEHHV